MSNISFLKNYLNSFEQFLFSDLKVEKPKSLFDPIRYLLDLGGKRIRPCLVLMAYDLYQSDLDKALPAAMSVELFHNFSLMHDDIMDDANLRRGKETVHLAYDVNTAILSGDMMLIQCYQYLSKYDNKYLLDLLTVFNKTGEEVCIGQRMDMDFEKMESIPIESYIEMIKYKTSVLLAAALQMGAIIAGADKVDQQHLYQFGLNIGIAFQIQDDILDTFGGDEVGKNIGGDIIQNKKTYLYLKALELASGDMKNHLIRLYSGQEIEDHVKVEVVTNYFNSLVVKEYASQVMEAYKDLAVSHINQISASVEKRQGLIDLADFLIKRNS